MKDKELIDLLTAIRADISTLREELEEVRKAAMMTDLNKQNLFWSQCFDSLHPKIASSETVSETGTGEDQ